MLSTFETRFSTLLKKLEAAPSCDNAEAAFTLFRDLWVASNEEHASPSSVLEYLRSRRFCAEHGWQGLSTGVCYVDNSESPDTRLYLHQDGSIVIQRLTPDSSTILFSKPGRRKKTEQAASVPAGASHDIDH
ncbi:hypothetical protein [Comamonas sp. UBA7528]|uniref:hypothetical protein n=1 Tax=Comamonas sp. UBA7528 TaxID=1946391 RepID=UPI001B660CD9|nr:hypothetical protein [Comamonas sp. UBA7528]MBP7353283.1 hypothetical protein [Comamonas sp.]